MAFTLSSRTEKPGGGTGAPLDSTCRSPPAGRALPGTHLLNVLLENTELQPLVQPDLAVLPDVLELPLVVQHLVDDVEDVVHGLGVVGGGREGIGAAGSQGPLELVEERLPVLAHLPGKRTSGYEREVAPATLQRRVGAHTRMYAHSHAHTLTHSQSQTAVLRSEPYFIKNKITLKSNPTVSDPTTPRKQMWLKEHSL